MRLDGRRQSSNISDRRGRSTGRTLGIGGGIVGAIIVAIITLMRGGGIGDIVSNVVNQGQGSYSYASQEYTPDAEDQRLAELASKVLAGTEDVWTEEFRRQGWGEYVCPKMVLYSGSIQSGCGNATSQVGPFYCSADQTVYIDLDFFKQMEQSIGASGDFAYAYVIAHEVGHHVQYLLGTLDEAHSAMSRLPESEANKISVRLELQADYYAGVWGNLDNKMFSSIEEGDVENAINAASKIGDDYLQRKAYGYEQPESFNHGRSSQRVRWLSGGISSGDPLRGDTFSPSYDYL
ncbi:KPN_02809 family neutral zinc metallopeptidase [Muribaculum intestinale]|uniref:Neutral zinc metallopeptidase n=1 Tax=Muribaculum intestinale TaxID=1796646 RepID=A0A1B1SAQ4_9BACT|nr:neutral zinc metallopeptidase [Muribaculum intestinale]ANU63871.1 neutral zinc metallopeptidase [Muribaculum intestinale]ASB38039.1 neutral zinc metallopeptidase [Muribaculum intestinale]PWB04778.1 neutral zinc metallopeptidase [Muribaculum intestinale]PWB11631.1 neutral zinc metallopeptidase [Muribaculum intestinale]QQR08776.1 neutral zinc metallopeptidase [Muribaculum intestinale]